MPESSICEDIVLSVPTYNEDSPVPLFASVSEKVLSCYSCRILFVNDDSTDGRKRDVDVDCKDMPSAVGCCHCFCRYAFY